VFRTVDVDDRCLFARQMHDQVLGVRRACRRGDGKMYPEDTEPEGGPKGEMITSGTF